MMAAVLTHMDGDQQDEHDQDYVGRQPHANKCVFYSFYVQILADWINRRKKSRVPVSFPELLEAVLTAVHWTSSPTSWAYVFKVVTCDEGVSVWVP